MFSSLYLTTEKIAELEQRKLSIMQRLARLEIEAEAAWRERLREDAARDRMTTRAASGADVFSMKGGVSRLAIAAAMK